MRFYENPLFFWCSVVEEVGPIYVEREILSSGLMFPENIFLTVKNIEPIIRTLGS